MKNPFSFLLLILLVLFASCGDDNDNGIYIGESNKNVTIHDLNSPIYIADEGSDSIDLDGNLKYDLVFIKSYIPVNHGFSTQVEMTKKEGVQVVLSTRNSYPDTLEVKTLLDGSNNWSDAKSGTLTMQSWYMREFAIGNFWNTEEKYLGIKINDRYGWVSVTNNPVAPLVIREYAFMK
jgi:hypothetical protein